MVCRLGTPTIYKIQIPGEIDLIAVLGEGCYADDRPHCDESPVLFESVRDRIGFSGLGQPVAA